MIIVCIIMVAQESKQKGIED